MRQELIDLYTSIGLKQNDEGFFPCSLAKYKELIKKLNEDFVGAYSLDDISKLLKSRNIKKDGSGRYLQSTYKIQNLLQQLGVTIDIHTLEEELYKANFEINPFTNTEFYFREQYLISLLKNLRLHRVEGLVFDSQLKTSDLEMPLRNFLKLIKCTFNKKITINSNFSKSELFFEYCDFNGEETFINTDSVNNSYFYDCNFTKKLCTLKNIKNTSNSILTIKSSIKRYEYEDENGVPKEVEDEDKNQINTFGDFLLGYFTDIELSGTFDYRVIEFNDIGNNAHITYKFTNFAFNKAYIKINGENYPYPSTLRLTTSRHITYSFQTNTHIPKIRILEIKGNDDGLTICKDKSIKISTDTLLYENKETKNPVIFDNWEFGQTDFSNTNFLNALSFKKCTFKDAPNFLGSTFHASTLFEDSCKYHDTTSKDSLLRYRYLKSQMHEIGDDHQASVFQALEFESRYHTVLKNKSLWDKEYGLEKASSWILKHVHDYGRDLKHPFMWIIAFGIFFWSIYISFDGYTCSGVEHLEGWLKSSCEITGKTRQNLLLNWYSSWVNMTGPIGILYKNGIITPTNGWIKLTESIQMVISSLLWFFIITSIRRRFKV